MPDIISHIASGYFIRNIQSRETFHRAFPLILLGLVLPDLFSRPYWIIGPGFFFTAHYFHTPFACFFQTLVIISFFAQGHRRIAFWAITIGWLLHQGFDLMQQSLDPGYYYLFWPLMGQPFRIGLFWAGDWPFVVAITILLAGFTSKRFRRMFQQLRKNSN